MASLSYNKKAEIIQDDLLHIDNPNSRSDYNLFCNRAYRNWNFMVTWSIN